MSKVRVLLADDDTLFRQGVERLLSAQNDIEVVSEVSNGGDAVNECTKVLVDVVLIDISMPGLSSFEATRQIKKARPETKVLFLSMLEDEDYLHCAMESGASGYVLTDSTAPQLIDAIREVARGGSHLSPRMLAHFAEKLQGGFNKKVSGFGTLTPREREILKALAEGKSVKEIASDANLSRKTVEAHKFNLMRKLDIHNKAQLVHYAVRMKIVQVADQYVKILVTGRAHNHKDLQKPLSGREVSVLRGISKGSTNKEIATELGISESAVKSTLQHLFRKTGTRSRSRLLVVAIDRYAKYL